MKGCHQQRQANHQSNYETGFSGKRTARRTRNLRIETLEDRRLLAGTAPIDFLLESAELYSVSGSAIDMGESVIPLYTDYLAGGTYGLPAFGSYDPTGSDPGKVTPYGNDPDAGRGFSSFRITWDKHGQNGWFEFNVGTTQQNRPRDLVDFGDAHAVRFMAKGDAPGQQITVKVFRTSAAGGFNPAPIANQPVAFNTTWTDFEIVLETPATPSDLHSVQFILGDGRDPGNGTFWLDEVRINTEGFDPLRTFQSYRQGAWASEESVPETVEGRDVFVYPNRSFLYDNALGIMALLTDGSDEARKTAREVTDAIIQTVRTDGSYYNVRNAGHVLGGDGTPLNPLSPQRGLGDNAWFGMALVNIFRTTGDVQYLNRALAISDWAENTLKDTGALGGYFGGFADESNRFEWKATEHNIDTFQLNTSLARTLEAMDDLRVTTYAARATHAGDFVMAMFDNGPVVGKFWTGTVAGSDTINTTSVPLDAQAWAVMTLGQSPVYATAIDWNEPIQWMEDNLSVTDGTYSGFTFSTSSKAESPGIVWFEGTAQAAGAYAVIGDVTKWQQTLQTLEDARLTHPNGDGRGIVAASNNELTDSDLGAVYDARLHVGATAWHYFAQQGINPFQTPPASVRVQASLVSEPTLIDEHTGEHNSPPEREWIDEWASFYVEIWVSTPDTAETGVVSAQVDLTYNTDYFTATGIEYGPGFDLLQIGTIDDATGVVDDLGAGTLATDVGDDQYALLARVRFEPTVDDPGVPLGADGKYITPVNNGFGLDNPKVMLVGPIAADVELGDPPDTELWPVMYDIDDDGYIGLGDLAYFASAYGRLIETTSPWFIWASDFDCSGHVDLNDLSYFASNYGRSKNDGLGPLAYPDDYPGQRQTAAMLTERQFSRNVEEATPLAPATPAPGDANRDGVVDRADAAILAAHWRMAEEATWADGDFNGDGRVNDADAAILASNWVTTVARPPVEAAGRVRLRPALETYPRAVDLHRDERAGAHDLVLREPGRPTFVANERLLGELAFFHEFQRTSGEDRPSKSALSIEAATDLVLAKLGL